MSKMIGVDVGGTFTDIFVLDEATGAAQVAKVPTSRPDQSAGFLDGIGSRVDDLSTVSVVVHGTTAGTAGAQGREDRGDHHPGPARRAGNAPP